MMDKVGLQDYNHGCYQKRTNCSKPGCEGEGQSFRGTPTFEIDVDFYCHERSVVLNSAIAAMRSELQTPKIIVSPCDPTRQAPNETLQGAWKTASKAQIAAGLSYGYALGGDSQRPSTVLALTTNIKGNLESSWSGADETPVPAEAFAGLNKSQGQLVNADGSTKQSTNADLGANGKITKAHKGSRGGQTKGDSSITVLK